MSNDLYRIVYMSQCTIDTQNIERELNDIEKGSSARNAEKQISGQLIYCEKIFIQTLEGQRNIVTSLVEKIKQDKRHNQFKMIFAGMVKERDHPDWSHMQIVTDAAKLAQFTKYITSVGSLPLNTMGATQTKDILNLLASFNNESKPELTNPSSG